MSKIPELPEVEIVVRDLKAHSIEGKKVIFNKVFDKIDSIRRTSLYKLDGLIIEKVERYGKYIIIKFEKSAYIVHLGMSGKLILDEGHVQIPRHTHWLIQMDDGWQLRYIDHRHFGNLFHMTYKEAIHYVKSRLGPEPWDYNAETFILNIRQNKYLNKTIKEVLLDQKLIAGIGNIYASETCFEAFIHPKTLVKNLNDKQLENILYCSRRVLDKAIKNNGTSFRDYKNAKNKTGNNQHFLSAYRQKECRRCKVEIEKEKIANRMTYFCNNCQRFIGGD